MSAYCTGNVFPPQRRGGGASPAAACGRKGETGIKTEQGEDRCLVQIEMNGEMRKFFTNSEEMKNILQQIREMPDGFPFETTIKAEQFGKNKTKYVFT